MSHPDTLQWAGAGRCDLLVLDDGNIGVTVSALAVMTPDAVPGQPFTVTMKSVMEGGVFQGLLDRAAALRAVPSTTPGHMEIVRPSIGFAVNTDAQRVEIILSAEPAQTTVFGAGQRYELRDTLSREEFDDMVATINRALDGRVIKP